MPLLNDAAVTASLQPIRAVAALVGYVQCGRDEPADVHLRGGGEKNSVRIGEENLAVGLQCTLDRRDVRTGDTVEGDRAAARLHEGDAVIPADGERLPVDVEAVARLVDGHRVAAAADVPRA